MMMCAVHDGHGSPFVNPSQANTAPSLEPHFLPIALYPRPTGMLCKVKWGWQITHALRKYLNVTFLVSLAQHNGDTLAVLAYGASLSLKRPWHDPQPQAGYTVAESRATRRY